MSQPKNLRVRVECDSNNNNNNYNNKLKKPNNQFKTEKEIKRRMIKNSKIYFKKNSYQQLNLMLSIRI